jgi:hypothetical protein
MPNLIFIFSFFSSFEIQVNTKAHFINSLKTLEIIVLGINSSLGHHEANSAPSAHGVAARRL